MRYSAIPCNVLVYLTRTDSDTSPSSHNYNSQTRATSKIGKILASIQIDCPVQPGPNIALSPICVFDAQYDVKLGYVA